MLDEDHRYAIDWFWGRVGGDAFNMTEDFNHLRLRSFKTRDNPDGHAECCNKHKGGWWYGKRHCFRMFLNGDYPRPMYIHHFGTWSTLIRSRMMFRRQDYNRFAICKNDNPCQHGGTCRHIVEPGGHNCTCIPDYCGANCELTCENGGTCYHNREENITKCLYNSAFTGKSCNENITTTTASTTVTGGGGDGGDGGVGDEVSAGITGTTPAEAGKKSVLSWIMTFIIALLVMILILLIGITGKEERQRRRRRIEREEKKK